MIYIEALSMTVLLIAGLFSAISDFHKGIILNKMLLTTLIIGAICHAAMLLLGAAQYYPYWLLCMLVADLLAFAMFWGKLWAAGDAKLFMTLFFLLPPRIFDDGQIVNGISPYIFIFIPALIWILVDSIIRWIRKEEHRKQPLQLKKFLLNCAMTVVEATAIYSVVYALFPVFAVENELITFLLVLIYAYCCGSIAVMHRWLVVLLHALVLIVVWIVKKWNVTLPDVRGFTTLITVMIVQRIAGLYNYQLVPTSSVVQGMIPAAETVVLFQTSRVQNLPTDFSEQLTAKMSDEEAAAVRRWETSAKGKSTIWIVRKVPFAFMITIGFVAWMIFKLVR